jgi:hypothetical protein
MSTSIFLGGKRWPVRKADNPIAICEPNAYRKCGSLDVPHPYGSSWPVTGIALSFTSLISPCALHANHLSILFSNTLNICSSLNVRDDVSHIYKLTGKITVLEILIFMLLGNRHEDKRL